MRILDRRGPDLDHRLRGWPKACPQRDQIELRPSLYRENEAGALDLIRTSTDMPAEVHPGSYSVSCGS
jgi:hypothetical protein